MFYSDLTVSLLLKYLIYSISKTLEIQGLVCARLSISIAKHRSWKKITSPCFFFFFFYIGLTCQILFTGLFPSLSLIHAHCALKHVPMGPVPSSLPREPWGQGGQQCCHCGGGAGGTAAHVGASPAFSLGTTWSRASHVTSLLRLSYL